MSAPPARGSFGWLVVAHAAAAALLGAVEAARLGSLRLGLALIPVFATTGLVIGLAIAGAERLVRGRAWWLRALGVAAPSLVVTVPVAPTLFAGAYAETLPLAGAMPVVLPLAAWLAIAGAIALGTRLAGERPVARAAVVAALALVAAAIAVVERRVLGAGYPDAQIAAALAVIVLAGVALRVAWRARPAAYVAPVVVAVTLGATIAAVTHGLEYAPDRRLLAERGDHGRDLVRLWRALLDLDRDGSSALLGGGDCDDLDASRHPGAIDVPGDGIDQDCDGADAVAPARPAPLAAERAADLAAWRRDVLAPVLARTRDLNVLLVTVDALRFDVLAPGAPGRAEFPRLTRLLDEAVLFTRAMAPAAGTDVAMTTLLSGRLDPFQEVRTSLGEAMRALGRKTTAAIPNEVLRHVGRVMIERGIDRLRPVYTDWKQQDVGDHISAGTTTAEGLRALDAAGARPWFTWLHYFDVHEHHQLPVPDELRRQVSSGGSEAAHRYRALLWNVDRAIGRMLDELAARGQLERTIVVFASDHGESLGEDPRLPPTHGQVTYQALVRIPFAIRVPGVAPGVRTDLVSLVDLAPTLLALLGDPAAMAPLDGVDLVPALLDGPAELRPPRDRALVIHEQLQWSVVEWPYQLIVRPEDDLVELYDLEHDPAQRDDLAARFPALTARLRGRHAEAPAVRIDRTVDGRAWRERQARRPPPRATP